ncbi:MAG: alanine racemase [Clostridia bacterium]|nr:alanine racemase [Clostridia bacterium]
MLNKAVIDLRVLKENATAVKGLLPNSTKLCAVVKADAYGHGAEECANALYKIADCFAVALVEEGIKLRLSGIDNEILVLSPVYPFDLENLVRYNLTATIFSLEDAILLCHQAKRQGKRARAHVKFNCGMNRQGIDTTTELENIFKEFSGDKWLDICGMYGHLSNPQNKNSLKREQNKFLLANNCVKRYNNKAICHLSSSGGVIEGAFFDMVRVGILLYGYTPYKTDAIDVKPIMKIYAPIIRERNLKKGDSALYGTCRAKADQKINLVRYGYADGLFRRATIGQFNNRCMDVTAVTDIKKENGFFVVLSSAKDLADKYGTISYEILVKSAVRAEKIYLR